MLQKRKSHVAHLLTASLDGIHPTAQAVGRWLLPLTGGSHQMKASKEIRSALSFGQTLES
jgi:hypothetical protein